jgi:hypothetical protein
LEPNQHEHRQPSLHGYSFEHRYIQLLVLGQELAGRQGLSARRDQRFGLVSFLVPLDRSGEWTSFGVPDAVAFSDAD